MIKAQGPSAGCDLAPYRTYHESKDEEEEVQAVILQLHASCVVQLVAIARVQAVILQLHAWFVVHIRRWRNNGPGLTKYKEKG
jgi:hypothetical protein